MAYSIPGSRYNDLYSRYPRQGADNPVDKIGPSLDTVNPRPSYQAAAGGGRTAPAAPAPAPAAPATPGVTSPELAGLQHSLGGSAPAAATQPAAQPAAQAPATPSYLQPLLDAIPGLAQPQGVDPNLINQITRANQGAANVAANQLREKMAAGSGGLVAPGESGLADTALGSIYRGGAQNTASAVRDMAARMPELNLSRILAAGNLGRLGMEGDSMQYGKEMDALRMLMDLYGAEQGYQQAAWSPYYTGVVNAYGR